MTSGLFPADISSLDIITTDKLNVVLVQFQQMSERYCHENVNRAKFYIDTTIYLSQKVKNQSLRIIFTSTIALVMQKDASC